MKIQLTAVALAAIALCSCGNRTATATTETVEDSPKAKVVQIDEQEFNERISDIRTNSDRIVFIGERPAVVDFYADWCGPCQKIAPIMEKLAEEYAGRVDFYKVDVDNNQELAKTFDIRSIPLVYFIPVDGQPQAILGAMDESDYREKVEDML